MVRIKSTYAGKCCKCGTMHAVDAVIAYDASAPRGKKAYCLNCAGPRIFTPDATEAEIARIKQQIDAKEDREATPHPGAADLNTALAKGKAVKPPVDTAIADEHFRQDHIEAVAKPAAMDLAAIIAAAVAPMVQGRLDEARVRELIEENTKPKAHTITVKSPAMPEGVDMGRQHKQFEELLQTCNARMANGKRLNVWVTGTAGTGKTTAAENVAKALGLKFAATGSIVETYKLFGFISPGTGAYVATPFRLIWEFGGVFICDDFDGSDPVAVIELNNALANGSCTFPDGCIPRHSDCVLILTANTWGGGATNDYVGRMRQDAAFLDRFATIDWEIDEELERDTCSHLGWVTYVQGVRRNVKAKGLKVLVTPRASYYGAALLTAGLPLDRVKAMTVRKGMTQEQWDSVCTVS